MLATILYGVLGGVYFRASSWIRVRLGNWALRFGMRSLSISTAITSLAFLSRDLVKTPLPGPISKIVSEGAIFAASIV